MNYKKYYDFCLFNIKKDWWRVIWEVTNECNYNCYYCIFNSKKWSNKIELSTKEIFKTIDDLKANWYKYLKITWGEPFLRQDIFQILEYWKKSWFKIDLSTNASLINSIKAQKLKKLDLEYIHVSLDGADEKTQSFVRWKGSFEATCNWIQNLVKYKNHVRIWCLIFRYNQNDLEEIIQKCVELWVNEIIFSYMEPIGRIAWKTALLAGIPPSKLAKTISLLKIKYSSQIKINYSISQKTQNKTNCSSCPWGSKFLYINYAWQVSVCTYMSQHFPNLLSKESLKTRPLKKLLGDKNFEEYFSTITLLQKSSIAWCPKTFLDKFNEVQIIKNLFKGSISNTINKQWKFSNICQLYSFTTENLKDYYQYFNFKDKEVLCIWASWDHMLNAYLLWAKQVDVFDINLLSKYYIELKIKAVQKLDFDIFTNYFLIDWKDTFSYKSFQSILNDLSTQSKIFWTQAYSNFANNWWKLRTSELFNNLYDKSEYKIRNNIYLQDSKNYKKLQKIISDKEYNFYNSSLLELNKILWKKKYDLILLSNISDYIKDMFDEKDYLNSFKENIIKKLYDNMKKWWIQVFGYIYDSQNKDKYRSDIDDPKLREKAFWDLKYFEQKIQSVIENNYKDLIIYTKK